MKKTLIVFDTASGSTKEMAEIIRDEMKNQIVRKAQPCNRKFKNTFCIKLAL